ncbi:lipopolysaccharide biosynthesis protein [Chitinophaga lutea]
MLLKLTSALRNRHFHSLLGNLVTAFFNVLTFAMLARLLSLSVFGEWVVFLATYSLMDQVRTALLQSGLIRFYAGVSPDQGLRVAGSAWYLSLMLTLLYTVVSTLAWLAGDWFLSPLWRELVVWLGPLCLLSLPFNFATWILQAAHRFDKIVQIRIIQNGSFLLFLCLLWWKGAVRLDTVLYAYAASLTAASIYALIFRWTMVRTITFRTREQLMELYRYGRMIVGSMLTSSLLNYSDNLIIRTLINPAAVAIYAIPQKFMEVIEILLRSFVATAQPTISSAANSGDMDGARRAFARYTGIVTIIITPIVLLLLIFTEPLITLLAGKEYLEATGIVRLILLSAFLFPIDRFTGVTLDMINKPNVNFYKNLLKLILNITLDLVFVLLYNDVLSVALASVLNLVFAVIFGYYFLHKYLPMQLSDIWNAGWQGIKKTVFVKKFS